MRLFALVLAGALLTGAEAQAQPLALGVTADGRRTAAIPYGDLDLADAAGAKTMLGRLERAGGQVCGPAPSTIRDLNGKLAYDACLRQAVAEAVRKLDAPAVTAAFQAGPPKLRLAHR